MSLERCTDINRNTAITRNEPFPVTAERFYGKKQRYSRIVEKLNERPSQESAASPMFSDLQSNDIENPTPDTPLSQHTVSASPIAQPVSDTPEVESRNFIVTDQSMAESSSSHSETTVQEMRVPDTVGNVSTSSRPIDILPVNDSLSRVIADYPLLSIEEKTRCTMNDDVSAICLSKDGSLVVVAQDNGDISLLNTLSGAIQREWHHAAQSRHQVEPMQANHEDVSMDGEYEVDLDEEEAVDDESEVDSDAEESMDYDSEPDDDTRVSCLALAANQQQLAVGRDDGQIRLYNLSASQGFEADNRRDLLDSRMPTGECVGLAFTGSDQGLVVVRENGTVDLCDVQTDAVYFKQELLKAQSHSGHMASLVTSNTVFNSVVVITPCNEIHRINYLTGKSQSIEKLDARATAVLETANYYAYAKYLQNGVAELSIHDRHTGLLRHRRHVSHDEFNQGKFTMSSDGRWLLCGVRGCVRIVDLVGEASDRTIALGSNWDLVGLACHPGQPFIVMAREREVVIAEVVAQEPEIVWQEDTPWAQEE